jgi:hypothetical protein
VRSAQRHESRRPRSTGPRLRLEVPKLKLSEPHVGFLEQTGLPMGLIRPQYQRGVDSSAFVASMLLTPLVSAIAITDENGLRC